jgi:2-(1,2-epoxy-1,2-dihydrophenyl)acetyl-CoA isomerase
MTLSESPRELIVERDGPLAMLRLNRPERLNALSMGLLQQLAEAVPQLVAASEVRAIMLTGEGRAFCAGGDVGAMSGASDPQAALAGMQSFHGWLTALWTSEKPVITAVNGAAAGGGFGIAMLGDLVVASEDAFFKTAFPTLGLAPDYALGFTLPRIVGASRAADLLYMDRRVSAQEALALGLVSHVWPAQTFAAEALQFARHIASAARGAQLTKRLLRFEQAEAFSRYLELEARTQVEAFHTEDFREGVAAFRERRPPAFRGR